MSCCEDARLSVVLCSQIAFEMPLKRCGLGQLEHGCLPPLGGLGRDWAQLDTTTCSIPQITWPTMCSRSLASSWVLASSSSSASAITPSRTSAILIGGRPLPTVQRRVRLSLDNVITSSDDDREAFLEAHEVGLVRRRLPRHAGFTTRDLAALSGLLSRRALAGRRRRSEPCRNQTNWRKDDLQATQPRLGGGEDHCE